LVEIHQRLCEYASLGFSPEDENENFLPGYSASQSRIQYSSYCFAVHIAKSLVKCLCQMAMTRKCLGKGTLVDTGRTKSGKM